MSPLFIPDFSNLNHLSFFLVSLAKCLSILLIFLRTYIPAGERVITK